MSLHPVHEEDMDFAMQDSLILHAPFLLEEHIPALPAGLFGRARLFCPGLEDAPGPRAWRPGNLPFAPASARRLLADMLDYAGELAGRSRTSASRLDAAAPAADDGLSADEAAALRRFVSGEAAPGPVSAPGLEAAQKILLLAANLEQQCLEAGKLASAFGAARDGLLQVVGVDDDDAGAGVYADISVLQPYTSELAGEALAPALAAWERVLEAMAAFAPEGTAFLLTHPAVIQCLEERGVSFAAVPDRPWLAAEPFLRDALGRESALAASGGRVRLLACVSDDDTTTGDTE